MFARRRVVAFVREERVEEERMFMKHSLTFLLPVLGLFECRALPDPAAVELSSLSTPAGTRRRDGFTASGRNESEIFEQRYGIYCLADFSAAG